MLGLYRYFWHEKMLTKEIRNLVPKNWERILRKAKYEDLPDDVQAMLETRQNTLNALNFKSQSF